MLLVEGELQIHNLLQVKNNIGPVFNDFMTILNSFLSWHYIKCLFSFYNCFRSIVFETHNAIL